MKKNRRFKQLIPALLVFFMVVGVFTLSPITIQATEEDGISETIPAEQEENALDEAIVEEEANVEIQAQPKALQRQAASLNDEWHANIDRNPLYKWYDGSNTWSATSDSPRAAITNMVEGVDYVRAYHFLNDLGNVQSDWEFVDSAVGMNQPGFIYERITPMGRYEGCSTVYIRHNIFTLIDVEVTDQSKLQGQVDPEPIVSVSYYNNPNQALKASDFAVTRVEGEGVGSYPYSLQIKG